MRLSSWPLAGMAMRSVQLTTRLGGQSAAKFIGKTRFQAHSAGKSGFTLLPENALALVRGQAHLFDSMRRADFVVVRCIAGDSNSTEGFARFPAYYDTTGNRDDLPAGNAGQGLDKMNALGGGRVQPAGARTDRQGAIGFAKGDFEAEHGRTILLLECDEVAACIEHRDRKRLQVELPPPIQR